MKTEMRDAAGALERLLERDHLTAGMCVRVHGENLTVGRPEPTGAGEVPKPDDRVRLTRLSKSTWGLSVKRHTGRWERTPFSGTLKQMVGTMHSFMQHLVGPS